MSLFRTAKVLGAASGCAAAFTLFLAVLFAAHVAVAAPAEEVPSAAELGTEPEGYRPTPIGPQSEAYDVTDTGPNHLRRMSPTEALPASPQPGKIISLPEGKEAPTEAPY